MEQQSAEGQGLTAYCWSHANGNAKIKTVGQCYGIGLSIHNWQRKTYKGDKWIKIVGETRQDPLWADTANDHETYFKCKLFYPIYRHLVERMRIYIRMFPRIMQIDYLQVYGGLVPCSRMF